MTVQSKEPQTAIQGSPRVLVVEDESIIALDIRTKLGLLGYNPVGMAGTGEEAIEKAAELRPDLVLMDVRLRGEMDGIEAAGRIQEEFGIPVVFITAFGDQDTMSRAKATNPFGYLIKPFQEKDLRTTVEMALYRYRMEKALRDAQAQLEAHGQRQATIAELGLKALSGRDVANVFDDATAMVTRILEMDAASVFELQDGQTLLLRAGVGWPPGLVGTATLGVGRDSLPGYALLAKEPVVVSDLHHETRFRPWKVALDMGILSSISVVIQGRARPYGVLIASSTRPRTLTRDEIHYLQALANVLAMAIDRKQDEERLRHQATILQNVRDGIIVTDLQGTITYWNAASTAIFGYTAEEMLGKAATTLYPGSEEERQREWEEVASLTEYTGERTRVRKDGSLIIVEYRIAQLLAADGNPTGLIAVGRDVTQRKQMEETIRQLSTPTLQVREGMLLVPLIGVMDPQRSQQLMDQALGTIHAKRARVIVIDLTGAAAVDDTVAQHLVQTAAAAGMLGATVIFTGISGSIAGTLVDLGVNLKGIRVAGDLQSGIEEAERLLTQRSNGPGGRATRPRLEPLEGNRKPPLMS